MPSPYATLYRHFDVFSKMRPRGGEKTAKLLKLFLKRTHLKGKYFAELVKPILQVPRCREGVPAAVPGGPFVF